MSARYCRNCGFRIERSKVSTGRIASGPFWRDTWVHADGADRGREACMWRAAPKRKGDRTLYQQIADAKAAARVAGGAS